MRRAVGLILAILLFAHAIVAAGMVLCIESSGHTELEWSSATCCECVHDEPRSSDSSDTDPTLDRSGCECHDQMLGAEPATSSVQRDLVAAPPLVVVGSSFLPPSRDLRTLTTCAAPIVQVPCPDLPPRLSAVIRC